MRGNIIFFVISVLILFISGCTQTTKTNVGGIDLEFLDSQPLIECIDSPGYCLEENSAFNVGIKLLNSLTHRVDGARVCISDISSDSIGGIPSQKPCIEGISVPPAETSGNKLIPGEKIIYFPEGGGSYAYNGIGQGNEKTSIYAELEYPVDSSFKINDICVKKSPNIETDFLCETKETFSGTKIEGNIAPVTVEKVIKNIVAIPGTDKQTKLRANIYLKKSPNGKIIWNEDLENLLFLEANLGNDLAIFDCNSDENGLIEMKEISKEVQCEAVVDLNGQVAFKEALNIRLQHNYYILLPTGTIQLKEGISS